jgi:hypothetical protein
MLAITPLSITTSASWGRSTAGATTRSGIAVSIAVESSRFFVVIPSTSSSWRRSSTCRTVATRGELRSTGPVTASTRSVASKSVSVWKISSNVANANARDREYYLKNLRSRSPSTTIDATIHRRSAISRWRPSRSRTASLSTHMGRDVGLLSNASRTSIEVEAVHIELISHVGW